MTTYADAPLPLEHVLDNDDLWAKLYRLLLPKVKGWTYNSDVCAWRGQEYDVAWDIVLTAIERTLAYIKNARQQGVAVHSPEHLSVVIAKNYYRDCRRQEQRLQRFSTNDVEPDEQLLYNQSDHSEEASEKVYEEWLPVPIMLDKFQVILVVSAIIFTTVLGRVNLFLFIGRGGKISQCLVQTRRVALLMDTQSGGTLRLAALCPIWLLSRSWGNRTPPVTNTLWA